MGYRLQNTRWRAACVLLFLAASAARADAPAAYILQSGDDIEIKAYNIPELDQAVRIRPDGKISLLLLGDVQAAGLTADRLGETLGAAFARHYRNPRISVIVRGFSTLSAYVGGEVLRPGLIPLTGATTALQAVVEAGGLKETSHGGKVLLLRPGANGEPASIALNVDNIVSKREADVPLRAGDILYVPKNNINVYVGGEVMRPGLLPLNGELTVMAAVIQAGGLKETAKSNTVMLVRNNGDGAPLVKKLRLDDAVRGRPDTVLQPFDVVFVPRSTISRVDRFVDQYIRQVLPVSLTSGFSYIMGATVLK
jgi:polysaccharide export outer membrane protein